MRSDSDSISACEESTTSFPAAASCCASSSQSSSAQGVASRAHRLAQVDDVHRPARRLRVKFEQLFALPVVEDRAKGNLHGHFQGR